MPDPWFVWVRRFRHPHHGTCRVLTMHTALIHRLLLPVFVLWVGGAVAVAAEIQIIDFEPVDTAGSAPFRSVST